MDDKNERRDDVGYRADGKHTDPAIVNRLTGEVIETTGVLEKRRAIGKHATPPDADIRESVHYVLNRIVDHCTPAFVHYRRSKL